MAVTNESNIMPQLKDGTNFANWKFRIKLLLEERGLEKILVDEITEQNKAQDAKGRSIIVQCIFDKYLEYVKKSRTTKEMIESLENVFERNSTFNKLHLKKQLLTLKCDNSDKLQDHFLKFDKIMNNIESSGGKMDETDKVCHLLLTMPEAYENIVTAIEAMSVDKKINLGFVKSCLLDAEVNKDDKNKTTNTDEIAFSAPKQIECYKCHKKGHIASECRTGRFNFRKRGYRRGGNKTHHQSHVTQDYNNTFLATNEQEIICNKTSLKENKIEFIIDSGATENLIKAEMEKYMKNITELETEINIKIANGETIKANKKGIISIVSGGRNINVEALIVPQVKYNIISVKKLITKSYKVIFNKYGTKIISDNQIWICKQRNGLFILEGNIKYDILYSNMCTSVCNIWHKRLGHLNRIGLKILKLPVSNKICEYCMRSKLTRIPFFTKLKPRSNSIGELIYTDIAGPITPTSYEGYKYFQTITDDHSHFVKVHLLKKKSEAEENLINYIRGFSTQKGVPVKRIRCDNGGEFSSNNFKQFCIKKGINIEYTRPYSPQQNGVSERLNRTLYNKARTMMIETELPKQLWSEAILCATYQLNRCPSSAINNKIPAEIFKEKMNLNELKVFGSKAWSIILPRNSKLDERAKEKRMVGYSKNGYRLWDPVNHNIIISRDVKFDETQIKYKEESEESDVISRNNNSIYENNEEEKKNIPEKEEESEEMDGKNEENEIEQQEQEITKSNRTIRKPQHLNDYELYTAFCLLTEEDPKTYEEAINRDEGWEEAIENELEAHRKMNTWTVTTLPKGKRTIDAKWIFRTKDDGTKKARIVARGFQEENNFENIYAPVARLSTVRLLLVQSLQRGWNVKQLDIPTAFLNSEINSEIYMKIPKGIKQENDKVLKMNRGLYRLRERPKCWNKRFNKFANDYGLKRSNWDFCLYIGNKVWLLIFVDDILLTGDEKEMNVIIKNLKKEFNAKYLGEASKFLGMSIERCKNKIKITQKSEILKTIKKFNMEDCKGAKTPITKGFQVNAEEEEVDVPYRQLIGSLLFISTGSRPDITFATSYLSQFLDKPKKSAWKEAKRILRYLKETINVGLIYTNSETNILEIFSDADWANNKQDRKSISGSVSLYCGNAISWFSRKQACVSLSTAEAEYIAAATSACELINLQGLCKDFNTNIDSVLYIDNRSAIDMAQSYENSRRTKHIDTRYHFIKNLVTNNKVKIKYVESKNNLADMFTKSLSIEKFNENKFNLNIT